PDFLYGLHGSGTAATPFTGTSKEINTDLLAGSYNLVVKDNNACQSNIIPVTITEPAIITFNVRADSVSCFDGSDGKILVENATGGTNTFKAYLTKSGGSEEQVDFPVVRNLSAGTYSIRLVDANNCTSETKTITIFQPEVISITTATITQELSCHNSQDGVITIEAIGGRPYSLQYKITGRGYQASNVFSNLPAGIYEIWVKNSKGNCETKYTSSLQIVNPDEIVITSIDKTNVLCHNDQNGTAKINAKGGTGTLTYYLNNAPASIANNPNNTGQFSGLGELSSSTDSKTTTYSYTITDQNGCPKSGNFVIVNPAELTIKKLDSRDVTCNDKGDGWIELEVTGGTGNYTFKKNGGEVVTNDVEKVTSSTFRLIRLTGTFNYTPVVLDSNNCSKTLEETVTIVNPDVIKIVEPIEWGVKKCYGNNDDVTVIHVKGGTPGYYYSLDNGTTYGDLNDSIFTSLQVGNKYPRVKDKNGCETPKSEAYMLKEPDKLQVYYKFKGMDCYDDPIQGKITLKILGGTSPYTLCIDDETFTDKPVKINKTYLDTTTYINDDLLIEHEYKFFLKDSNNCHIENITRVNEITDYFADTTFTAPLELILDSIASHPVFCGNSRAGRIEFWASGGTAPDKYRDWKLTATLVEKPDVSYVNKGINSVEELGVGAYNLVLTDARGCKATSNIGSILYTDTTSIDAENKAVTLTISDIDSITCNQTQDGSMSITVQNFLRNGFFWEALIWEGDTTVSTRPNTTSKDGFIEADPVYRTGYKDHYVYSAYSQKILEDIGIGLYQITVTDSLTGCQAFADTILYSINGDSCPPLNFYNAFDQYTGGDKYNDWKLGGTQNLIYNLKIYSAWGELIYDSDKENGDQKTAAADKNGIRWNGLDNKQRPVPAGTYIYLLRTGAAPNDTLMNGNVTILRSNGR
ncbi:MAG TPA: hypothetical protein PKH79_13170, partial [Prolixibacteraceae bacterium]|nr:hypothetical protein [Prolixibacteraceae bacterium]